MTIPHGKKVEAEHHEFLDDLQTSLGAFVDRARSDADQRGIFKLCTAAHTVLGAFDGAQPLMAPAAGICRRVALLSTVRQLSLVRVEMRRLIECIEWSVYFAEHPVELEVFEKSPGRSWASKADAMPIESAANAEIGMFFRYAKERLAADPSGLGVTAANALQVEYGNLSGDVHAARGAVGGTLALAFDPYDGETAAKTRDQIQRVFGLGVLLRVAADPRLLSRLDAIDRAWFDWLVGKDAARKIRGEPFGIPR